MAYRRLEYTGGFNPFAGKGIVHFVEEVKKRNPSITQRGINELVMRTVNQYDPRTKRRTMALFGFDILTATPEALPVWSMMGEATQRRILDHPYNSGEKVDPETERAVELERLESLPRQSVHRSFLIHPPGLQQTYVWRRRSEIPWVQEVTDQDYRTILMFRDKHGQYPFRRIFQDYDLNGPYVDVRAYDMVASQRHVARTMADVEALHREFTRPHHYRGVNLKQE